MDENKMLREAFAEKLSKCINSMPMTQQQLADYLNVSKAAVSSWCGGNKIPRVDKIYKIAELFNIAISDLVTINSQNPSLDHDLNKLSPYPQKLLSLTEQLNTEGKESLINHAEMMVESGRYKPSTVTKFPKRKENPNVYLELTGRNDGSNLHKISKEKLFEANKRRKERLGK